MKAEIKKILSILLAAAFFLTLPPAAFAEEGGGFGGLLSNVQQSYQPPEQSGDLPDAAPSAEKQLKEAAEGKDLTILIYMCGSNLESTPQSSASRDIREIIESNFDTEKVSILLMAGGAKSWHLKNIGSEGTGIYSLRPDGITRLWEAGTRMNMGEASTLSTLLQYGARYFPAEKYAVIVWDHGGGAIGGVCQDETTNDSLSLSELRTALRNSPFAEQKLAWLGFDACLMASAEVAIMLSPFAEYLIASEETEPGYGWNYSFLKDVEKDRDGTETGRRVIDSYFDWYEERETGSNLTMSCIDLSKTDRLAEQTDLFFSEVRQNAFPDRKTELSKAVRRAKAFGSVDENASNDADNTNANVYDLLDLGDLVSCLYEDGMAEGQELLRLLQDEVVVYTRNNMDARLAGMTVYHPLRAKNQFLSNLATYRGFGILPEYVRYIDQFGHMLLETPAANFSGLLANIQNNGKAQQAIFSLPLSETQRNNLDKAQLLVLQRAGEEENAYHLVSVSNETYLDRKGNLNGAFVFRNLFLTREDGSAVPGTAPLTFSLNEDGQISLPVTLVTEDEDGVRETKAYLICGEEEDSDARETRDDPGLPGSLTVSTLLVYDELAQCYTSRSLVDLSALTEICFPVVDRAVTRNADGAILGFDEWNTVGKTEIRWRAEDNFRLRFLEDSLDDETLYAAFGLTDLQSNRYTSELVKFTGESGPGTVQFRYTDRNRLLGLRNLFCDPVDEQGSVWLSIDVTNMTRNEVIVGLSKLTVNGQEIEGETFVYGTGPNYGLLTDETQTLFVILDSEQLAGIRELRSLRFTLTVTDAESEEALGTVAVRASVSVVLPHTTTVLVYLCGGDLERFFGAATDDIREMAASRFDGRYTKLLIMSDGMRSRENGPEPDKTEIIELGEYGMRTVWTGEDKMNMADGETLKSFLDYAYARYPAERYALILWGHGGGPTEGMYPDGQASGDSLSLEEIRTALSESFPAEKKLSWIGFDACLMATLETALAMTDYADVLVASQGREENSGWNYSFLQGLERDADGETTGRRIVDAYFADDAEEDEERTLSCIRLDRIERVWEETVRYFNTAIPSEADESYAEFRQARERACSFGPAEDGKKELVDLVSLSREWEPLPGCGEALRAAVRAAVVCSEANIEDANGLSAYCP